MIQVTCDLCGKQVTPGDDYRYVVKMEVFAAHDPCELTEADLDEDNMEAVSALLRSEDEAHDPDVSSPPYKTFRYDLCAACHKKFLRDPLGKEAVQKFHFSKN